MAKRGKFDLHVTHRYNVSPEKVFDTFLDVSKAKKFMFSTVNGKMIKAEIDPKVGGGFLFVDRRPEGDAAHYGTFTHLDRPNLIAFEFAVQKEAKEKDLITLRISTLRQGCEVTLTHEVKDEFKHLQDKIIDGWDGILDGLGAELRTK